MAGNANQKLKLLYLAEIFKKETDENNVLSAADLCKCLERYKITAERKSIYSDIDVLKDFGYEIITTRAPKNGYFLASREFETPEVRLLMDAVQSANFITPKKTKALLEKIYSLTSGNEAEKLKKQIYIDSTQKCANEEIYYSIDRIGDAIQRGKQISFEYRKRAISADKTVDYVERTHTVNPYAMIWSNDHYYLIANNIKYENLMPTRIDRMKKVTILEDSLVRPFREVSEYKINFDSSDYASKHMNMFSGEAKPVELICNNSLIENVMDRFGEKVPIYPFDDNCFMAKFSSAVNDGLVSWIMQFGGNIKVRAPKELKNMVIDRAKSVIDNYE